MDIGYELYGQIRMVVRQETKWLKHYVGSVLSVDDPLKINRVQVAIQELGWTDNSMGIWACPRETNSMKAPAVGSWVEIYFIMGDPSRPVYLGGAVEHMLTTLQVQQYTSPQTQVIFEDPTDHSYVKYDESTQQFDISDLVKADVKEGKLVFINGTEHFVLGDTLKTQLQKTVDALTQLQTDFNAWTPVPNDGGAALKAIVSAGFVTKVLSDLSGILSTVITGK